MAILRARGQHRRLAAADRRPHHPGSPGHSDPRPEQRQRHLVAFTARIERHADYLAGLSVVAEHRRIEAGLTRRGASGSGGLVALWYTVFAFYSL